MAPDDMIEVPAWVANASHLWDRRHILVGVGAIALAVGFAVAFALPKQYESTAKLMPPETGSSSALVAAVLGRAGSSPGLGGLAGSLLGTHSSGVLFLELLHSRVIADHIIDHFDLQRLHGKRYRVDMVKYLARHTVAAEDKKSGVLSLTYTDTDPQRARDITQAYVEELNGLMTRSNTSSARREREFIERRLVSSETELQAAEKALSEFSSNNSTLDIKEQTHAMVDAAAKLQAEKIVGESELASLQQIYGEENVRVRAARARISGLQRELTKMSGTNAPLSTDLTVQNKSTYPTIRQLPRLAVPYANLYRRVRIQETVFELLSQQYEIARIQEAKDTPVVSEIDMPLVAERKSFPPRLLLMVGFTVAVMLITAILLLIGRAWSQAPSTDPRKALAEHMLASIVGEARR